MFKHYYDYAKLKHIGKMKLCFMDTDSFIAHIKSEDISADLLKDIEKKFKTLNYEVEIPLAIAKKEQSH